MDTGSSAELVRWGAELRPCLLHFMLVLGSEKLYRSPLRRDMLLKFGKYFPDKYRVNESSVFGVSTHWVEKPCSVFRGAMWNESMFGTKSQSSDGTLSNYSVL